LSLSARQTGTYAYRNKRGTEARERHLKDRREFAIVMNYGKKRRPLGRTNRLISKRAEKREAFQSGTRHEKRKL